MDQFGVWAESVTPPEAGASWEDWMAWYDAVEPSISQSAMEELNSTGTLKISNMVKRLGVGEGLANFVVREFTKRHRTADHERGIREREKAADLAANRDEYLYHVTTKRRLPLIKKNGLSPNAPSQFENYTDYSRGKVFFCEKGGIGFWKQRVEEHEEANNDRPSRVVLLRVPRSLLEDKLQNDGRGTEDSRKPSYYVSEKVPAKSIEVVG